MQPCGEPRGSAAPFDSLTVGVISIQKQILLDLVSRFFPVGSTMFWVQEILEFESTERQQNKIILAD